MFFYDRIMWQLSQKKGIENLTTDVL
ncbi:hypothetical protein CCAND93_590021 [Capnocytophaga canis]|uniref:Uncharacterized protein n=1 Tax=Capnocytophaga canis TaxID=1848903 RepID=A0A0B7IPK7_9FLAO|nr:hypothetical protein CCAND93_590021 [Capnocytophaga canis]